MEVKSRVWRFGENISTDYMSPGFSRLMVWEERRKYVLHIHRKFSAECAPGDCIVAGRNFGCGSARESAARNLRDLGISSVIAESFGRIFFRNCIAIGLPAVVCEHVAAMFKDGDELELDFPTARICHVANGTIVTGNAPTALMIQCINAGGLLNLLSRGARSS
jgi:3-isopropylmalate dehydratase small subunit